MTPLAVLQLARRYADRRYADGGSAYTAPVSEFTTPGDTRRQDAAHALGWDVGPVDRFTVPWGELARRMLTYLPMAAPGRSPVGSRVMADAAWAMRTPSAVTGGWPIRSGIPASRYAPIADSSTGLVARHPHVFGRDGINLQLRQDMRGVTQADMGFVGPSAPANVNSRLRIVR